MEKEKSNKSNAAKTRDDEKATSKDTPGISSEKPSSDSDDITYGVQDVTEFTTDAGQQQEEKQIGKYEIVSLIGEGGMGKVYKAYDPSLKRHIALKIIRGDDPGLVERFLREARSQAQVEHDNVCKIHEIGEAESKPFIAMQFIEGKTLRDASPEMTREQKVKAIMESADALHSAHKLGLIHRDIKPSNIMVERAEDGSYKPYIMDFGIAREQKTPGLTVTGILIGTPAYMPPEQARGDIHNLDRRTDVYALGATLYELLTGNPPFLGNANADIAVKVLQDEPLPLRKVNPLVPEELQTIVMKCLEKDPQHRYDTARALAEDLGRFLEGEPILAHPPSLSYRLYKKARKNKTMVIVLVLAIIIGLVALGYGIYITQQASRQAELSQQLGQQIEKIDSIMYRAYTLPLHDVRPEKKIVRNMIQEIKKLSESVSYARGPGSYAVGRAYLVLNEHEKAKEALEEAWNQGYQKPEAAYALGRTFGALFHKNLQEGKHITVKEMRDSKLKEAEKMYKQPALLYLKMAKGIETIAPEFVEAQIALYENKLDEALNKTRKAYMQIPDLYEAHILEGDIYLQLQFQKGNQLEPDEVEDILMEASEAYSTAVEIARSDAKGYLGVCWSKIFLFDSTKDREKQNKFHQEAIRACDDALQADPENVDAYIAQSRIYNTRASDQMLTLGKDTENAFQKSIKFSRKALDIQPDNALVYRNIGEAYLWKSGYDQLSGKDSSQSIENALDAFQKAITIRPRDDFSYYLLGWTYAFKANNEYTSGKDWHTSNEKSIQAFLKVIEINPYRGNPKLANACILISNICAVNAIWEMDFGNDPSESVKKSIMNAQKAISIKKNIAESYSIMVTAYIAKAHYELQQGINPLDSIKRGEKAILEATRIDSHQFFCSYTPLSVVEARWLIKQQKDPAAAFDRAIKEMKLNITNSSGYPECYLYTADVYRWIAEWKLSENKLANNEIKQGLEMSDKTISIMPTLQEAYVLKGILYSLKAKSENDPTRRHKLLIESKKLIDDALSQNRNIRAKYQTSLDEINQMLAKDI